MEGLGKEVDGRDLRGAEGAGLSKPLEVARERCRIAAHVGYGARRLRAELLYHVGRKSCARWVNDDDVCLSVGKLFFGAAQLKKNWIVEIDKPENAIPAMLMLFIITKSHRLIT